MNYQFKIDVWGTLVPVELDEAGNGLIEDSEYNDKLPVVGWEIMNPQNLLTSCEEINEGFKKALMEMREHNAQKWARSPDSQELLQQLSNKYNEIQNQKINLNKCIREHNALFMQLHNGLVSVGAPESAVQEFSGEGKVKVIYLPDEGIDVKKLKIIY